MTTQPCFVNRSVVHDEVPDFDLTEASFRDVDCGVDDHAIPGLVPGQWAWACNEHQVGGTAGSLSEADAMVSMHFDCWDGRHDTHVWCVTVP